MTTKELESGLKKFEIIAPLLNDGLECAQRRMLRREIMDRHGISARTLRRYLQRYGEKGYDGLIRAQRKDKGQSKSLTSEVLDKAIELRRELPGRSTRRIITILESEGVIAPGQVASSTLSRQLAKNDASRRDIPAKEPTRRFQKEGRNALWQADIKFGPYIPGKSGKKIRTYLLAILDDATRLPVHAEFYDNQKLPILEDCFKKALRKFGVPDAIYIDNGKIFISKWFRLACARLGIRHIATKPYSPQSKGKIERFNGIVNEFMEELSLEPVQSLEALNRKFRVWLEEGYVHRPHSGLGGKTPFEAYRENAKKVRFASGDECRQVFLWEQTRSVDKTGAVRLQGRVFDAGADLINKKVDLRYDPFDLSVIEIWRNGLFVRKAEPLVIAEFVPEKPKANAENHTTANSRLLGAYEAKNQQRDKERHKAIVFGDIPEESDTSIQGGDRHV